MYKKIENLLIIEININKNTNKQYKNHLNLISKRN